MAFGHDTTTDEVLEGIDLTGKRALVTGASGGLGEETARALASKGAAVTIAARNVPKAQAAADGIKKSTGNADVDVLEVELSVPDSIRKAAVEYQKRHGALNILVNNAGVMACPLTRTSEGWEMQLGTNHFGHFLFTCLLAPVLKAGAARVVNLSSAGHRISAVDFDDPHFQKRDYDKWVAYGQAKTANVLFSVELNKRLQSSGVTANAVHPGAIQTELGRHLAEEDIEALLAQRGGGAEFNFKTIPAGAATSTWAATSPDLEGRGGLYLEDCHVADVVEAGFGEPGVAPYAVDVGNASKLWTLTEEALGERFDLA